MKELRAVQLICDMGDGGAQKIVLNYLKDLSKDVDVRLVTTSSKINENNQACLSEINVLTYCAECKKKHKFFDKIFKYRYISGKINEYIKKNDINIIHIHLSPTLIFCLPAILKNRNRQFVYTVHSSPLRTKGLKLFLIKFIMKRKNFHPICVTEEYLKEAEEHYGVTKFLVVHNGVDFEYISHNIVSKSSAREFFSLGANDFIVCAVGRLERVKRLDLLMNIFSKLIEKKPNAKLLLAGDGKEKDNLVKLVTELNLSEKVVFLGNLGNIEKVIKLYCASDVLVITSESETSSLVLMEAQKCNLKCVISDGVPSESIINNNVIKMKKNDSLDNWVSAIIGEKSDYSRATATYEEYEVHAISNKMKKIYYELLNKND